MKLAWKELVYSKKKYLLIEAVIVLLVFMVLFLSGLAAGLGRAVSAAVENIPAERFLLSDSAENLVTMSTLEVSVLEQVKELSGGEAAPFDIQRMYISKENSDEKLNITYFAIEAGSFLEPAVYEGSSLASSNAEHPIILDDDFSALGISAGDVVLDSSTGLRFEVAGFTKDAMYTHISVGYITTDSYTSLRTELSPYYEPKYHAIAVKGGNKSYEIDGASIVEKSDVIKAIPSYTAEQTTINMITWVLIVVSAAIIGVFYYILTLQKERHFGVMKAIGMGMKTLCGVVCGQVCVVACFGAVIANILAFTMAAAVTGSKMPFYLPVPNALIVTAAFVLISLAGSLLSVLKVARIDPIISIGGAE